MWNDSTLVIFMEWLWEVVRAAAEVSRWRRPRHRGNALAVRLLPLWVHELGESLDVFLDPGFDREAGVEPERALRRLGCQRRSLLDVGGLDRRQLVADRDVAAGQQA